MTRSRLTAVALAAGLAGGLAAVPAAAETISAPTPGAVVQEDAAVTFDWRWDSDQYWTDKVIFTTTPDANDPIWLGGDQPGKVRVAPAGGYGESHAVIQPKRWGLTPGTWYWRPCSKAVDGEDDKCYQRSAPQAIVITAAPPTAPVVDVPEPSAAPRALGRSTATARAKRVLKAKFAFSPSRKRQRVSCAAVDASSQRCSLSWLTPRYRYRGTVVVFNVVEEDVAGWRYALDVRRVERGTGKVRTIRTTRGDGADV